MKISTTDSRIGRKVWEGTAFLQHHRKLISVPLREPTGNIPLSMLYFVNVNMAFGAENMGVLVISFDAVGDKVFEAMAADGNYPNVARFKREAYYRGGLKTIFVSNTYPIHATISTGKLPKDHGVISNLLAPNKNGERPWAQMAKNIKTKTIWDAAKEKKLSTAAMIWPVTCGAKIDWHMPEVHPEKGQNIVLRSFMYGSPFFQIAAQLRHGRKLIKALKAGGGLLELDSFVTAVTCDMLEKKRPDLALVHLVSYDSAFHYAGSTGRETEIAKKALDANLGQLLKSWGENTVIVFSDHSQLDVNENVNLHDIYGSAVFEQVGGSAFVSGPIRGLEEQPWFERYLTKEEMEESGYADKPVIGIAAKLGYVFSESDKYKGAHGYPTDYENYNVFYAIKGKSFLLGQKQDWLKNRLMDVTAIIARELDLDMDILKEYGVR